MDAIDQLPVFPKTTRTSRAAKFLQFVMLTSLALLLASLITLGLITWRPAPITLIGVPVGFFAAAIALAIGSRTVIRSIQSVRREKQGPFRRGLLTCVVVWSCSFGIQLYCFAELLAQDSANDLANAGSLPFAIGVVAMHAIHTVAALGWMCWVTVQAANDRYDHEYYRPVGQCAIFWHFLGLAWLSAIGILAVAL